MARGWKRSTVFAASLVALVSLGAPGTSSASPPSPGPVSPGGGGNPGGGGGVSSSFSFGGGARSCHLGNGITHVVELGFDNVHFFRDNPNVPSDLEMLPNLLNFLEDNGTVLSNNHTPLIAHTGDDLLTTFTGLYGDRQGMPVANDYRVFNPDGTTDAAGSFAYWTDPVYDTADSTQRRAPTPTRTWCTRPPRRPRPRRRPPPTRSRRHPGCRLPGPAATLAAWPRPTWSSRTPASTSPKVFGVGSPEDEQLVNDPDSFKDPETADYVGLAIHCARSSAVCANAQAVKYGETTPTNRGARPAAR